MKKILTLSLLIITNISFCQSNWDGIYPWYSKDRLGDIRKGVALTSFDTEVYVIDDVRNINKFHCGIDTLLFVDDHMLTYFFDFENKNVVIINYRLNTKWDYDILRIKKHKLNKEKTDGIFTLKIKKGSTKINYYINTYEGNFYKIVHSKKNRIGVVFKNDIDGTSYKFDD